MNTKSYELESVIISITTGVNFEAKKVMTDIMMGIYLPIFSQIFAVQSIDILPLSIEFSSQNR